VGKNLHVTLTLMCDKRNKEKGKRKPGEHFHFCLFFLVGKINVVLKQQAHFRPGKLLETFGRNSLFSPIFLLFEKKKTDGSTQK
jgi:hypothetical protein